MQCYNNITKEIRKLLALAMTGFCNSALVCGTQCARISVVEVRWEIYQATTLCACETLVTMTHAVTRLERSWRDL